ncbi:MAG: hypothetical protein IKD08_02955 [Alphaproteobacteria bacterium]|nr:hypothetical protein [Alphaproteobacteria bacterium]
MAKVKTILTVIYYTVTTLLFLAIVGAFLGFIIYFAATYDVCASEGKCAEGTQMNTCASSDTSCVMSEELCRSQGFWHNDTCYLFSYGHTAENIEG